MAIWLYLKRIELLSDRHSSYSSPIMTKRADAFLVVLCKTPVPAVCMTTPINVTSTERIKHAADSSVSSDIPCRADYPWHRRATGNVFMEIKYIYFYKSNMFSSRFQMTNAIDIVF
jgi:hypothetical protein